MIHFLRVDLLGQDLVEDDAEDSRQRNAGDRHAADGDGLIRTWPSTSMTAAMSRLRVLVKST